MQSSQGLTFIENEERVSRPSSERSLFNGDTNRPATSTFGSPSQSPFANSWTSVSYKSFRFVSGGIVLLAFIFIAILTVFVCILAVRNNTLVPEVPEPPSASLVDQPLDASVVLQWAFTDPLQVLIQNQNGSLVGITSSIIMGNTGQTGNFAIMQPSSIPVESQMVFSISENEGVSACPNSILIGSEGGTCLALDHLTNTVVCTPCIGSSGNTYAHWYIVDKMPKESSYSMRFVNCAGNQYLTSNTTSEGIIQTNPNTPSDTNTSYDFYAWGLIPN